MDRWHTTVQREIKQAAGRLNRIHPDPYGLLLDLGSGGISQSVPYQSYVHIDIALERLRDVPTGICADAQLLPIRSGVANCVLCFGCANYCSLIELISEISSVSAPGAHILFHIELSNSLEFFLTRHFRADATLASTFYQGKESLWLYSRRAVRENLIDAKLQVLHQRYFHIASALIYRISGQPNAANIFASLDTALNWIPGIGGLADSAIFTCVKST